MSEIYSYWEQYRDKIYSETLYEHILNALSNLNIKHSRIILFGEKLTPRFRDIARLAIIFHDIGKTFFQSNYFTRGERKTISFKGHEYISTYIFHIFNNRLIEYSSLSNNELKRFEEYNATTFSIFYHHHAMGVRKRKPYCSYRSLEKGFSLIDILKKYMDKLRNNNWLKGEEYDILCTILDNLDLLRTDIRLILRNIETVLYENIWREIIKHPNFRRLCLLSLATLIAVDYTSAKKRPGVSTRFSNIIKDFYNYYFIKVIL